MKLRSDIDIAIVAPCPLPGIAAEGWMARIAAIDRQLADFRRVYLNLSEQHDDDSCSILWHSPQVGESLVRPKGQKSTAVISDLARQVRLIYVHTLHLADLMLPWLPSNKVCVDIHGITPEEEVMMGRPHLKQHYEIVERQVLEGARRCVAVSNAMIRHYTDKYPGLHPQWSTIPIVEFYANECASEPAAANQSELPVTAVYTGGTQAWQNVDAMLELSDACAKWCKFHFFSADAEILKTRAAALKYRSRPEIGFCPKQELPSLYQSSDFGLVLRDDNPVNRVASPTKLAEYMDFGIVPIVRSPSMGDFNDFGFVYVTEQDFREQFFPDRSSREWMAKHNRAVLSRIAAKFESGIEEVRSVIAPLATSAAAGQSTGRDAQPRSG